MERATAAQLRYLERLLAGADTTWPMVRRRWPQAPTRFDDLDRRQAGSLIAILRHHGHLPVNHGLDSASPKRVSEDAVSPGGRGLE
ncbi:MAG: hypothetical protein F4X64_16205 [Chloroflexi bacterium]|nr:hypothetical protein [Chloroflexota bacterium]